MKDIASLGLKTLAQAERDHIEHVLERLSWNKKLVAEVLGISRATLYRKIEVYGITRGGGNGKNLGPNRTDEVDESASEVPGICRENFRST